MLGIGALLVLQNIFSIPQERLSVMAVYVTAGVLYGVLFRVCKPFRKWHIIMLAVVPAVFCAACWLVSPLFYIVPLNFSEWLCVACVIPGELMIFWGLVNLLGRILGRWSGGFPPMPRTKKACAGTVLVLSAAYAVWLFLILGGLPCRKERRGPDICHETAGRHEFRASLHDNRRSVPCIRA